MKKILFLILLPITINADWVDESNYTMNTILLDSSDKHYTQIKNYCINQVRWQKIYTPFETLYFGKYEYWHGMAETRTTKCKRLKREEWEDLYGEK